MNLGGLDQFLNVLETFPGEHSIETKVLGLLNNIAEVSTQRHKLLQNKFLNLLRKLLYSKQIDVSYFAAGIVAHLASDSIPWQAQHTNRMELISNLVSF